MLFVFQIGTFVLGFIALGLAVRHMLFFHKSGHHLSRSMIAMLVEQVVSAGGTMFFASNSLFSTFLQIPPDQWNNVPPHIAIGVRILMFGAMVHSTVRLSLSVQKVLDDTDKSS